MLPRAATPAATAKPEEESSKKRSAEAFTLTEARAQVGLATRLGALAALSSVAAIIAFAGYSLYACVRDSFVVPTILSPSSEPVVATRLRLGELRVERVRALAEMDSLDADLNGSEKAVTRLRDLERTTGDAFHYTSALTSQKTHENNAELAALLQQKQLLVSMLNTQEQLTGKAQKDVEAGLISRSEFSRQQQALSQTQLALLDNNRATLRGQSALDENNLTQAALTRHAAPKTPELVHRQEQMIRVELEIVRIDSEKRAKTAQRDALVERVAQIDEMVQQIEERPLFQAMDKDLELAFVPYTQLSGVAAGAGVYSCVWGLVWCHSVGVVSDLVPGEVVQADPWGSSTRGEYAVLELVDHDAARAKTLRIRAWGGSSRGVTPASKSARATTE